MVDRSVFLQCDIVHTELPDGCLGAMMSVDVWRMLPNKPAAAREIIRLLRPGGRFMFTTWASDQLLSFALPIVIRRRSFERQEVSLKPSKRHPIGSVDSVAYEGILAAQQTLIAELGQEVSGKFIAGAQHAPALLSHNIHILMVVRRAEATGISL